MGNSYEATRRSIVCPNLRRSIGFSNLRRSIQQQLREHESYLFIGGFDDFGAFEVLADVIRENKTVLRLTFYKCHPDVNSWNVILNALKINKTLQVILFRQTYLFYEQRRLTALALQDNSTLRHVHYPLCPFFCIFFQFRFRKNRFQQEQSKRISSIFWIEELVKTNKTIQNMYERQLFSIIFSFVSREDFVWQEKDEECLQDFQRCIEKECSTIGKTHKYLITKGHDRFTQMHDKKKKVNK